ncbi:crossover junction endodeoxyribonuclease RuvC [Truepera radiovictrix]|uniref:Crossover junction endodeoxyribonuclease RuvC n=1 Tax=Truepera radiovictrix (strain DSM 17093 / CIP 108686 / LMG 22925 / RQ-24) TaxID=649638 RepID=D7CUV7_TRURR|nr:crossover junction endodeoxyribonuclease RuvC [Truepera radiovictrix]ADI14098.1 crossover junction endodeoxyribonuclease RuvC [Truepera radiovictrix DSM 17093]WMT57340.1 crossover junction endodeoxyribonuclease RuvC [Truepera radiovictrix]
MNRTRPPLTVVGLDPGLANLGLGAVREVGRAVTLLGAKLVRTSPSAEQSARLETLYREVSRFFALYEPDVLALEGQYFHRQREVAFKVGQACGVCLLAAQEHGLEVVEYGPMQVKQALVGTGRASKAQVGYMVRATLGLKETPESHHVADALALALTHLSARQFQLLR